MGLDFNEALKNYFANNPNAVNQQQAIKDALDNIAEGIDNDGTYSNDLVSIWDDPSVAMNHDVFKQKMEMITNGNVTDADIDMLWNILDMEDEYGNSDGILSADELGMITGSDGKVSRFSIWNGIYAKGDDIDNIASDYVATAGPTGTSGATGSTSPTSPTASTAPSTPSSTTPTTPSTKYTNSVSNDQIAQWADVIKNAVIASDTDNFKTPSDVIDYWISSGNGPASFKDAVNNGFDVSELKASYNQYKQEDENKISALLIASPDMSRYDAIAYLEGQGALDKPIVTADTPLDAQGNPDVPGWTPPTTPAPTTNPTAPSTPTTPPSSNLTDAALDLAAKEIHDTIEGCGSDMDALYKIISDPNYSDEDIAAIIARWETKYGKKGEHLIEYIDDQWANSDKVQKAIAQRLCGAAQNGNPEAIEMLAKQIKSGTDETSGTADAFVDEVFKQLKGDPDTLLEVCNAYEGGHNAMIKHIENDNLNFWGNPNDHAKDLVKQIKDAIKYRTNP